MITLPDKKEAVPCGAASSGERLESNTNGSKIQHVHWMDLKETPENWTIYRKPDSNDAAWLELAASVNLHGILQPLEVSADSYIISGHRRWRAAVGNELSRVPVIVDQTVTMATMSSADRVALLIERNRGTRVKTDLELYLEAAAAVDPDAAVERAIARKAQVFTKVKTSALHEVETTGTIRRTNPQKQRAALLDAVLQIIERLRVGGFLPTSARHIHYQLLPMKVRTSAGRAGYIYGTQKPSKPGQKETTQRSDKLLSKLLCDARSEGLIDNDAINDETRQAFTFAFHGNSGAYVSDCLDGMFSNYFSDVHADQPAHVELLIEKNTLAPLIYKHVGKSFRLPLTALHGYGSYPASRDVAARFNNSGKDKLIVIYISDLDPEGVNMPQAFKKYLEYDFNVQATVIRAAITKEQVAKYDLPHDAEVKLDSTRATPFIKEYGNHCWELDCMPPTALIEEITRVVKTCLNMDVFNRAMIVEREKDIELARLEAAVGKFVKSNFAEIMGGQAA